MERKTHKNKLTIQSRMNGNSIELSKELINKIINDKSYYSCIRKNSEFVTFVAIDNDKTLVKSCNNNKNTDKIIKEVCDHLIKNIVNIVIEYFNEYYVDNVNDTFIFSPSVNSNFSHFCDIIYDFEFEGDLFISNHCTNQKVKVTKDMIIPLTQIKCSSIHFFGCEFKYKSLFLKRNLYREFTRSTLYQSLQQSLLVTSCKITVITNDKYRIIQLQNQLKI